MAYRLSQRFNQDSKTRTTGDLDFSKLALVFVFFGLLSLLTSFVFSLETGTVASKHIRPSGFGNNETEVGPIEVKKNNKSFKVNVKADLQGQSWSVIDGQVLDSDKKYLFSFSKELSYYYGSDSDGSWTEKDNSYSMSVTFPEAGKYYILFDMESDKIPSQVNITVSKKMGSHIPHLAFGVILLLAGLVLNEVKNGTLKRIIGNMNRE